MKLFLTIYLIVINVLGVYAMGADKKRAIHKKWRVPEKTLFMLAALGGSIGTWVGMYVFRHKTKHWYFVIGMPLILLLQVVFLFWVLKRYILW